MIITKIETNATDPESLDKIHVNVKLTSEEYEDLIKKYGMILPRKIEVFSNCVEEFVGVPTCVKMGDGSYYEAGIWHRIR